MCGDTAHGQAGASRICLVSTCYYLSHASVSLSAAVGCAARSRSLPRPACLSQASSPPSPRPPPRGAAGTALPLCSLDSGACSCCWLSPAAGAHFPTSGRRSCVPATPCEKAEYPPGPDAPTSSESHAVSAAEVASQNTSRRRLGEGGGAAGGGGAGPPAWQVSPLRAAQAAGAPRPPPPQPPLRPGTDGAPPGLALTGARAAETRVPSGEGIGPRTEKDSLSLCKNQLYIYV